jgi:hypothetical protein
MDELPKMNLVWWWVPEQITGDIPGTPYYDDIATAYAIEIDKNAACGIILWAKYRGKWEPNPYSSRAVIARLLSELGAPISDPVLLIRRTTQNDE